MTEEARVVTYDEELRIEAYRFSGVAQSFPSHFHEYYVLGLMEAGQRSLTCRDGVYTLGPGDMLLLNPSDSHACVQCSGGTLSYRGVNFSPAVMEELAEEVTGERRPPRFSPPVIHDDKAVRRYRALHTAVMEGRRGWRRRKACCCCSLFCCDATVNLLQRTPLSAGMISGRYAASLKPTMPSVSPWHSCAAAQGAASPPCCGTLPGKRA